MFKFIGTYVCYVRMCICTLSLVTVRILELVLYECW